MINFASFAIEQASQWPEKLAYRDGHEDLTYRELGRRTKNLAASFHDLGIRQGDHVIIAMEDCVDWPVIFLACLYCNVIPLPLATSMGPVLFRQIADFVGCRHVFSSDSIIETHRLDIPTTTRSQIRNLHSVDTDMSAIMVHPDAPAWMNISSGSTGFPKVAVHRHQTLFEILKLSPAGSYDMDHNSVMMSVAKMSWNFGLHNSITYTVGLGATAIIIPDMPAAPTVFDFMNRYEPTIVVTSPAIIQRLLKSSEKYEIPKSVVHFHSSGEHLSKVHYDHFLARFGFRLNSCIGMMETCTNYAANPAKEHDAGTVGYALPGCRVKLVDDNDQECQGAGQVGEIWVNSPANACYYYKNYDKTRSTFIGDWVKTGDLAYWNHKGNLTFVGRCDDSFKVSDLIVNPVEVENALLENLTIEQIAIVGIKNDAGCNEVHAYVVPTTGFDLEQFRTYCKTHLFSHQCPKHIKVLDALPETMTNKKDRKTIKGNIRRVA